MPHKDPEKGKQAKRRYYERYRKTHHFCVVCGQPARVKFCSKVCRYQDSKRVAREDADVLRQIEGRRKGAELPIAGNDQRVERYRLRAEKGYDLFREVAS